MPRLQLIGIVVGGVAILVLGAAAVVALVDGGSGTGDAAGIADDARYERAAGTEDAGASIALQTRPVDTYPYLIRAQGSSVSGLSIFVNGIEVVSDYSFNGHFDLGIAAPFLRDGEANLVTASANSPDVFSVAVSRGNTHICSFSPSEDGCVFDASVAYELLNDLPKPIGLECADEEYLTRFFEPLDRYQTHHAFRFFAIEQVDIEERCATRLEDVVLSVGAVFRAAPSPREALHAPLGDKRRILLMVRSDLASAVNANPSRQIPGAAGAMIFEFDHEQRVLPVLSAQDAYIMMTQTQ